VDCPSELEKAKDDIISLAEEADSEIDELQSNLSEKETKIEELENKIMEYEDIMEGIIIQLTEPELTEFRNICKKTSCEKFKNLYGYGLFHCKARNVKLKDCIETLQDYGLDAKSELLEILMRVPDSCNYKLEHLILGEKPNETEKLGGENECVV